MDHLCGMQQAQVQSEKSTRLGELTCVERQTMRPEYLLQGCKRYNYSCSFVFQATPLSVVCEGQRGEVDHETQALTPRIGNENKNGEKNDWIGGLCKPVIPTRGRMRQKDCQELLAS